jgi:hypothetical protein
MNTYHIDKNRNILLVVLTGMLTIVFVVLVSLILELGLVQNLVLSWVFTTLYAIFSFLVIGDLKVSRVVEKRVYVDRPFEVEKIREVIKEVPVMVQIPVENKTIEVVDRPVYRDVIRTVRSPVRKLEIPRFEYVASSQEKRYHKRNCRLGKLIKKKFKVQSNSQTFFKRKKYKACKMCIKRFNKQKIKK